MDAEGMLHSTWTLPFRKSTKIRTDFRIYAQTISTEKYDDPFKYLTEWLAYAADVEAVFDAESPIFPRIVNNKIKWGSYFNPSGFSELFNELTTRSGIILGPDKRFGA
mmetsp:Transcript_24851/g.65225  ORF Transcript_24851/g.65225 Transcript_24851/m.65225 type:complete len:108 (-) Transcript_24851:225-548(-)